MTRAWDLRALAQPLQIVPPALHGHRSPQPFAHPRRDRTRRPERLGPASRRRSGERLTQLLLVRGREQRLLPMRRAARTILHPDGALRVVATSELADPVARIPRALGHLACPLAPGEQPEDLPPTPFLRLVRVPIAPFQLVAAQIRRQHDVFWHTPMLQHPGRKPYNIRLQGGEGTTPCRAADLVRRQFTPLQDFVEEGPPDT